MSTVVRSVDILGLRVGTANIPAMYYGAGTNIPPTGYLFSQASAHSGYIQLTPDLYGGGNITLVLDFMSPTGVTTGTAAVSAQLAAMSPGDAQSVLTKALATSQSGSGVINSTASGLSTLSITITNLDSVAAGDEVWIKITRTDTSVTGDIAILGGYISYSDGVTGSPGSGDVVGPASATNNAVALYDATTGKLIKNSAVTIDSSGNISGAGTYNGVTVPGKYWLAAQLGTAAATSGSAQTAISGLSLAYPAAGTYVFEFYLDHSSANTTGNTSMVVTATGGTISAMQTIHTFMTTTSVVSALSVAGSGTNSGSFVRSAAANTKLPTLVRGVFTTTASGVLSITHANSGSIVVTAGVGSSSKIWMV